MFARRARSVARFVALVALVAGAGCGSGCRGEAAQARRSEAGRLAEAVRVLRNAPVRARRPLLEALRKAPCSAEDLCALRKRCEDAYALELSATDGIAAVRHEVTIHDPSPPAAVGGAAGEGHALPRAAALLSQSEAELRRAVGLAKECADDEASARARYSL